MNPKAIVLALQVIAFCLLPGSLASVCFARELEVSDESAQINVDGWDAGLYVIAIDPQGRRVGYDFETKEYLDEFEAGFDIITPETIKWINSWNDLYGSEGTINLTPGTYTIEVLGTALTKYSVGISITRRLPGQGPTGIDFKTLKATPEQIAAIKALSTDFDFEGVIDEGLTSKYQFTYTSDPAQPAATAWKVVEPSSLKQDIELSRKIGWIDNDGVANSLMKKAEAIEAAMAKGNSKEAENQLNALVNEVNAQSGKHIDDKAVKILLEDVDYLLEKLGA